MIECRLFCPLICIDAHEAIATRNADAIHRMIRPTYPRFALRNSSREIRKLLIYCRSAAIILECPLCVSGQW
jgi:hypothetical protein